jgi:hypothetical protein
MTERDSNTVYSVDTSSKDDSDSEALQTQQHMQSVAPTLRGSQIAAIGSSQDIPPNQLLTPPLPLSGNILNHTLP